MTTAPEASPTLDLLEKNSTDKLDTTEREKIKTLNMPGVQKALDTIQNTTFKLSENNHNVPLDTIIKNYHATGKFTGEVRLPNETIPVQRGSDLAAWIQIFLIAKGHYLISNDASAIGIDAVIGENTNQAIIGYKGYSTPKVETTPNQSDTSKEDLDIDSLIIDTKIASKINNTNLLKAKETKADIKKQQIFDRGKKNGILDENGLVRSLSINIKTKTCIITVVNQTTGASTAETYNIPLENILINRSGEVSKERWVNEMYKVVSKAYEKKTAEQKKLDTEKERPGLKTLQKEWNILQKEAANKINAAKTWEEKIKLTDQYSGKYATLAKKIAGTKVNYLGAEYKTLTADIKSRKADLDKKNIEINCPNYIKEKYATLQKNIGSSNINVKWFVDSYIREVQNIIALQKNYEKRGMKTQVLVMDLFNLQYKLEKQTIYLANKADLDKTYTTLLNKFEKDGFLQNKKTEAERKTKVVLMENGTYRNNNQPTTYKESFASVGKTKEYDAYVKKFKELVA